MVYLRAKEAMMLGGPRIQHIDEAPAHEVMRIEFEDGRSASVWERFLVRTPNYLSFYNKWDPGMMALRHGHRGDHTVYVLEGSVRVGDRDCPKGTHIFLMHGDTFGPWIAGPAGCELLGVVAGEGSSFWADQDMEDYKALLAEHGAKQAPVPAMQDVPPWRNRRPDSLPSPTYDPASK